MILRKSLPHPPGIDQVRIKVVGVGGGGVNAVRRMSSLDLPGLELLCVNTDALALDRANGVPSMVIGGELTHGLGAGGDPKVGRQAAVASRDAIAEELAGADLVFIAAAMGGGTGTGAAPLVAEVAAEAGALTVAIVTTPFKFEGVRRNGSARDGLDALRAAADTVVVISNDRLLAETRPTASVRDSFGRADQVMIDAITSLSRLINTSGDVNIDFADIRAVVSGGGLGLMGTGSGEGDDRVIAALQAVFDSPLLSVSPSGAASMIYFVSGGCDVTMREIHDAGRYLSRIAGPDADIFFGLHTDPKKGTGAPVDVVLIATRVPEAAVYDPQSLTVEERVRLAAEKYYAPTMELPGFLRELDIEVDLPEEDGR